MRKSQFFFYENIFPVWTQTGSDGFFLSFCNVYIRHLFHLKNEKESIFFLRKYLSCLNANRQRRLFFFPFGTFFERQIETRSDNIYRKIFSYLPCTYCESFRSWQLQLFLSICPGPGWNAPILIDQCMLGIHSSHTISDPSGQFLGYILSLKFCRVFLVSCRTEDTLVAKSSTVFKCLHFSKDWMSNFLKYYLSEPLTFSHFKMNIWKIKK